MLKAKFAIIVLGAAVLLVFGGCGGSPQSSGSQSPNPLNLSGQWQFATSSGTSGTVNLTQQGTQITGTLTAPNYYGPVYGVGLPSITGTLNGTAFQATITGTYGPYACGAGVINISVTIELTGTVTTGGNSMAGQFVTQPTTCFSGNAGNWSATKS